MTDLKTIELHNFSDASTEGYGQCSYLRLVDKDNQVHCSLVMGKARVTHLKPVTIPRLELTAAQLSVKVSDMLKRELRYELTDEIFWTDSKVVLAYISNNARRFHTYVANRVQQIPDLTTPEQWRYVESKSNPADDASRGLSPTNLVKSSRWLTGPQFLWENCDNWRDFGDNSKPAELSSDDKEVRKASTLATVVKEEPATLLQRLEYFSDWFCAKKALALCIKYLRILRSRIQRKEYVKLADESVTVEELRNAELVIIKAAQQKAFSAEIEDLTTHSLADTTPKAAARSQQKPTKKSSVLHRLDPFLDQHGLIRVGGRIRQASIADEVRKASTLASWLAQLVSAGLTCGRSWVQIPVGPTLRVLK